MFASSNINFFQLIVHTYWKIIWLIVGVTDCEGNKINYGDHPNSQAFFPIL